MFRKSLIFITTAALGLSGAVLAGEIYKWTDEDGSVHYEDRPVGDQVERIDLVSRSTDNSSVQASIDARREREDARSEARSKRGEDAQAASEAAADAEQRMAQCQKARARMESYLQARRLYNEDEAGDRTYLDDSGVMKARERAQEQIQKYCN